MDKILSQANKHVSSYKKHAIPSLATAAVALAVAIPTTAALNGGGAAPVSAAPVMTAAKTTSHTCGVSTGAAIATPSVATVATPASRVVNHYYTLPGGNGNHSSGNNNGSTNSNGSGNGNGSGANANGNTQTNNGGLVGGVNANVPVSALNGSLNNVLSGNAVSVSLPVLSNNSGNSANVLNNTLNTLNHTLNGII